MPNRNCTIHGTSAAARGNRARGVIASTAGPYFSWWQRALIIRHPGDGGGKRWVTCQGARSGALRANCVGVWVGSVDSAVSVWHGWLRLKYDDF